MNPTHVMGRRVVAFIIDYVLLTAAFAGLFYALASHTTDPVHFTGTQVHVTFDRDTYYLLGDDATGLWVIDLLIALLYGGVIQGLMGGTIGKLICGIRVMREDGSRPGLGRGVLRWILLIVDDFPYFIPMLTGFIVALSDDRRRRVGDLAAGTFVVRAGVAGVPARGAVAPTTAAPPPGAWPPAPDPVFGQSAAGQRQPAPRPAEPAPAQPAPGPEAPGDSPPRQPTAPETAAQPNERESAPAAAQPTSRTQPTVSRTQPTVSRAQPQPQPPSQPQPPAQPPPAAPPPPMPPANWYPDPSGNARLRYWDGARWTDHTAQ